jgi:rhodanese-related sulfurtransferase
MAAFAESDQELEPRELERRMREDDLIVIDVREPYEVAAGRIPGTRHVPIEALTGAAETLDRDRPVAFVCRVGSRSGMASQAFRASGWEAYNLRGGVTAWVQAGLSFDGEVAAH